MEFADNFIYALTFVAALGCGLIAGVFFAFSTFVMKALRRLPPQEGIAAMQSINVVVINPAFLTVFVGTALVCALLIIVAFMRYQQSDAVWLLIGGGLYVFGTFAVTGMRNVPMNNALAAVTPADPESAISWARYLAGWTFWNHVRTVAALAATVAFIVSISIGQ